MTDSAAFEDGLDLSDGPGGSTTGTTDNDVVPFAASLIQSRLVEFPTTLLRCSCCSAGLFPLPVAREREASESEKPTLVCSALLPLFALFSPSLSTSWEPRKNAVVEWPVQECRPLKDAFLLAPLGCSAWSAQISAVLPIGKTIRLRTACTGFPGCSV